MHLIQILLPITYNDGTPVGEDILRSVCTELKTRFGGLTAYSRNPAEGVWKNGNGEKTDNIVIIEVMTDDLDRDWWRDFRKRLKRELGQEELVVRAEVTERL
ncbi:MAG TPA: hypothetical protein VHU23_16475 [Rhizomicrobium sp.]|jgi:hypothetical protein|nr:hypothetical protein [Rhizomicrobium sp.]